MRRASFAQFLVVCSIPLACADSTGPNDPPGPDGVAPEIAFLATPADVDGDGLLDVTLGWQDESGVDPTSLVVELRTPAGNNVAGSAALFAQWHVVEVTASGIHLEETIPARISRGTWSLRATVADSSGTTGSAVTASVFELPRFSLIQSIPVSGNPAGVTYCPVRDEVYVYGGSFTVVDAETFGKDQTNELGWVAPGVRRYIEDVACSGESQFVLTTTLFQFFAVEDLQWAETDSVPALFAAEAVHARPEGDRVVAYGYFDTDDATEARAFAFDPVTEAVLSMRTLASDVRDIAEIDGDLFLALANGPQMLRDWTTSEADPVPIAGATGELMDFEVDDATVYTLGTSTPVPSHIVATSAASGLETDEWIVTDARIRDIAIGPGGIVFAPATDKCSTGTCTSVDPFLLLPGGEHERIHLPEMVTSTAIFDQAAFRADGAVLFWLTQRAGEGLRLQAFLNRS